MRAVTVGRYAVSWAVLVGLWLSVPAAIAQDATTSGAGVSATPESSTPESSAAASSAAASSAARAPTGFFEIVFSGGWTGLLIMLLLVALSMAAVALVVEHVITIRHDVLLPPGLAEGVTAQLTQGNVSAAEQVCRGQPSVLAAVISAGLGEVEGGWPAVEKAAEEATAEQSARLLRKIEYLSVIGNIAPMVGLLGTVIGMIFAFQEVAESQGAARAAELAAGIYQALVTTVGGLLVAIPALAAYAVFRNRIDHLIAETVYAAAAAMRPIKRGGRRKSHAPPPATPTPPAPKR